MIIVWIDPKNQPLKSLNRKFDWYKNMAAAAYNCVLHAIGQEMGDMRHVIFIVKTPEWGGKKAQISSAFEVGAKVH